MIYYESVKRRWRAQENRNCCVKQVTSSAGHQQTIKQYRIQDAISESGNSHLSQSIRLSILYFQSSQSTLLQSSLLTLALLGKVVKVLLLDKDTGKSLK